MIRFALALAARGLAVFPCRPQDKRPATEHGCKDATTNSTSIELWWREEPRYNIAIATGASSNIFVVDVDGMDAEVELRNLERQLGEFPPTVEVITGRGRHVYFKWHPEKPVPSSVGKVAAGIDVRGTGGYVLAPPSVHPSGRPYCWSANCHNAIAAAPEWLLATLAIPGNKSRRTAVDEWRRIVRDGVTEGTRDWTLAKLTGHLLRRRVDPIIVLELMHGWNATRCAPPLPDEDVVRVVNSIAGKELRRRAGDG